MAGFAPDIDPTQFTERLTVPAPCAVEDCAWLPCETLHGRAECIGFVFGGGAIPYRYETGGIDPVPVAPVPLPATLPLLIVAAAMLWRMKR